jgi:hypothetical protein
VCVTTRAQLPSLAVIFRAKAVSLAPECSKFQLLLYVRPLKFCFATLVCLKKMLFNSSRSFIFIAFPNYPLCSVKRKGKSFVEFIMSSFLRKYLGISIIDYFGENF